jgi:hypothetical protein
MVCEYKEVYLNISMQICKIWIILLPKKFTNI